MFRKNIDQMTYLEQMYTKHLNHVGNHFWQYYNEQILLQWFPNE